MGKHQHDRETPLPKITVNRKTELLIKQTKKPSNSNEETPNVNNINRLLYVSVCVIS